MATKILANPTVKINNEVVPIVPNSFKFDDGDGETKVTTQSLGGDKVDVVISESAEDKIGKCSFEMKATAKNIKDARGWKKNPGVNLVDAAEDSFQRVFQQASIMNRVETELSAEGKFSLEWESLPAI